MQEAVELLCSSDGELGKNCEAVAPRVMRIAHRGNPRVKCQLKWQRSNRPVTQCIGRRTK
jgi:hypothetical protein